MRSQLLETTAHVRYWDHHFHGRRPPLMRYAMRTKAKRVCGGVLEPNTNPHLLTYDDVVRMLDMANEFAAGRAWSASIYLTANPNIKDIIRLWDERLIAHVKEYPPHGSTHTDESVHPELILDENSPPGRLMRAMEECGLPLKRHAEIAHQHGAQVDPYHRERLDLREVEPRFMDVYPKLRRVLAHISSAEAAEHMAEYGDPDRYICELTAHHPLFDRTVMYDGGAILPDHHCLPVIKEKRHLEALQKLLKTRPKYVVAGSDAALHLTTNKYRFDAFGGFNTYGCDLELYLQMLEELGIQDYADDFLYGNAKRFLPLQVPDDPPMVKLQKKEWTVDHRVMITETDPDLEVTPFGFHPNAAKRYRFQWKLVA